MKTKKKKKKKPEIKKVQVCEVCLEPIPDDDMLSGCEQCGKLFGSCCNSEKDGICVDCT